VKTRKNFKPVPIYALASGMYPVIPSMGRTDKVYKTLKTGGPKYSDRSEGSGNHFRIERRFSKDWRGKIKDEPAMWYQGKSKTKRTPYIQGNTIFQTRHMRPQWFRQTSSADTIDLIGIKGTVRGVPRMINQQLAKSMNVKLGGNYRNVRTPAVVPSAMAETGLQQSQGNIGDAKPLDFQQDKLIMNMTATSIGQQGHGQYGSGREILASMIATIDEELDSGQIKQREANRKKVEAAAQYFNMRIPQWNLQIEQIKKSQGLDRNIKNKLLTGSRLKKDEYAQFQKHFAAHGDIQAGAIAGMQALNNDWGTTGHFYSGSKQMTAQLLGNPDAFFSKNGVWETWPIDDYTFGWVGPFRGYRTGKRQFHYHKPVRGYYTQGYDASQYAQHGARYGGVYMTDIQNRMAGFLNASHTNTDSTIKINSLVDIVTPSHMLLTGALRMRPDVNLVQAGNAFNIAIDNLIKDSQNAARGMIPANVRSIMMKNRFKLRQKNIDRNENSIWAVPYISFFDVKSMGAGYVSPR
jgi:hypothetical protein